MLFELSSSFNTLFSIENARCSSEILSYSSYNDMTLSSNESCDYCSLFFSPAILISSAWVYLSIEEYSIIEVFNCYSGSSTSLMMKGYGSLPKCTDYCFYDGNCRNYKLTLAFMSMLACLWTRLIMLFNYYIFLVFSNNSSFSFSLYLLKFSLSVLDAS